MKEIMATKAGIAKRLAELKPEVTFWGDKYKAAANGPADERREAECKFHILCARVAELEWVLGIGCRRRSNAGGQRPPAAGGTSGPPCSHGG